MATKITKVTISNVSLDQAQAASELVAQKQTQLDKLEAKMNEEINRVKSKYTEEVTALKNELNEPVQLLEVFAKEQQSSWGKKKSMELLHCLIGFRTGQPKVAKDKKFTWDGVVELLKKANLKKYIRTSEEINKEAILSIKEEGILKQLKEDCFITIDQDEKFYVEVKKEEVNS